MSVEERGHLAACVWPVYLPACLAESHSWSWTYSHTFHHCRVAVSLWPAPIPSSPPIHFPLHKFHCSSPFWFPNPLFLSCAVPRPSAFDDLSQAHGGDYNKTGYGGSAQSQAKSAGSGPGKGTRTHMCILKHCLFTAVEPWKSIHMGYSSSLQRVVKKWDNVPLHLLT